ncbi:MAG: DinB family protein, partial [Bacteroidota bacterium]
NAEQLAKRVREVFLNGLWVANTNYKKGIEDVDWKTANHQISSLNTILKLTYHVNYYLEGVNTVFAGGELTISDKFSFDSEGIQTPEDWEQLKTNFLANAEQFAAHVETMSDEQLASTFVKEQYGSYQRNIDVTIEHGYYHLGQISIIRKMIAEAQ